MSDSDSDHKKKKKWFGLKKSDSSSSSSDDENKKDKEKKKRKVKRKSSSSSSSSSSSDDSQKKGDFKGSKKLSDEEKEVIKKEKSKEIVVVTREVTSSPGTSELTKEFTTSQGTTVVTREFTTSPGTTEVTREFTTSPGSTVVTREFTTSPGSTEVTREFTTSPGSTGVTREFMTSPGVTEVTREVTSTPGITKVTREVTVTRSGGGSQETRTEVRTVTSEHEIVRQERKIASQEVVTKRGSYEIRSNETHTINVGDPTSVHKILEIGQINGDEPKKGGSDEEKEKKSEKDSSSDSDDDEKKHKKYDIKVPKLSSSSDSDEDSKKKEDSDNEKDKKIPEIEIATGQTDKKDDDKDKTSDESSSSDSEDEKKDETKKPHSDNEEKKKEADESKKVIVQTEEKEDDKKSDTSSSTDSEDEKKDEVKESHSDKEEKKKVDEYKIVTVQTEQKKDDKYMDDEKKDKEKETHSDDEGKNKIHLPGLVRDGDDKADKDIDEISPMEGNKIDEIEVRIEDNKQEPDVIIEKEIIVQVENSPQDDSKGDVNLVPADIPESKPEEQKPAKEADGTKIMEEIVTTQVIVVKPDAEVKSDKDDGGVNVGIGAKPKNGVKVDNGVKPDTASKTDDDDDAAVIITEVPVADTPKVKSKDIPVFTVQDKLAPATTLWTTERDGAVLLRTKEEGLLSLPAITVPTVIQQTVNKYPNHMALCVKRNNEWKRWTYRQYFEDIIRAAKSMIKLGLEPYRSVGILGFNSPEWVISNFGAIYAGGLSMGIYPTSSAEACEFLLKDSECNIVIVENDEQLKKILKIWEKLPQLTAVVQYLGELTEQRKNLYTWEQFLALSEDVPDSKVQERLDAQAPNKACSLVYTLTWTPHVTSQGLNFVYAKEVILSYLPLSHIAAQILDMYVPIKYASIVYFAQPDALKGSLGDTMKAVRPTKFFGVTRVWEKIMEKMREKGQEIKGVRKKISVKAQQIGLRGSYALMKKQSTPFGFTLANLFVFNKIKKELGLDRCDWFRTGGAPVSKETIEFFWGFNIPLFSVYGMSENSGATTSDRPEAYRIGGVGPPLPGCAVKIIKDDDDNDEICVWGRHVFMGYLNHEEKTLQTLNKDFWLRSGDIGNIDEDGFVYITGRIKEIIITSGGENIAPAPIEECVKAELPIISNCVVIGDKRKFLSMLITLKTVLNVDTDELTNKLTKQVVDWCKEVGSEATTVSQIIESRDENVYKAIQEGINRANMKSVSRPAKVQKWCILPQDFSINTGELTPTMKVKRSVVSKVYASRIDEFYNESET